ncbi:TetR/AcrR family transcriptional regulator [Lentibacillus jeotgali]|uniref:TetR/AcrR family transcriptional regulator n=1 Tax=Lentibacillus jeotgali TaxID=558169 RepID=UPI0002628BCF|nr:TetR/AcrR family transcriptional regulator [Lentibacillus jeotgali]
MKNKIKNASIQQFDEKGYSETSIQEIVDYIGVTKGSFYYYYKSKQELLKDIHINYIEGLLKEQDQILQNPDKNSKDKLYSIISMIVNSIRTQRQSARIFNREGRNLDKLHFEEIRHKRRKFRLAFQQVIEEGIKTGEFKKGLHADILTFGMLGMTNWSFNWFNPEGKLSEEEIINTYIDILFNGIINER